HCEAQFVPKIRATRILAKLTSEHQPQFVCCLSSLAAVLGGIGFTAYAAANQYMDALACSRPTNDPTRWITINWDGWMLEGDPATLERAKNEPVILANEGSETLDRILGALDLTQVVVSTIELGGRFEQWVNHGRTQRQVTMAA